MNERIRRLLNEATVGLEPDLSPQRTVTLNELEKFAELIVQECCAIADEVERADMDSYVSKYIRAHFGVEK